MGISGKAHIFLLFCSSGTTGLDLFFPNASHAYCSQFLLPLPFGLRNCFSRLTQQMHTEVQIQSSLTQIKMKNKEPKNTRTGNVGGSLQQYFLTTINAHICFSTFQMHLMTSVLRCSSVFPPPSGSLLTNRTQEINYMVSVSQGMVKFTAYD